MLVGRQFVGEAADRSLLSDASRCFEALGPPEISADDLIELVARWVEVGGASLNKPTKFQVTDGRF